MVAKEDGEPNRGWVPVPDPTALTTDQLRREIAAAREVIDAKLIALEARQKALENASSTANQVSDRHVDIAISNTRDLFMEKLEAIRIQIADRDVSVATVAASLKEAALERQMSINKSLDQTNKIMEATTGKVDGKVDDLRERVTAIESRRRGVGDVGNWIATGLAALWALGATIALVAGALHH